MTHVIGEACVDMLDGACVKECPVDCICEGERMLYIRPDECVDCGACEPVCPVEAIYYEDDLPEKWQAYAGENAVLHRAAARPRRATRLTRRPAKLDVVGADTPFVTALPPQRQTPPARVLSDWPAAAAAHLIGGNSECDHLRRLQLPLFLPG